MLKRGHAQVGDRDEVLGIPKAPSGGFSLLRQAVHRLDVGVAAPVKHAAHHPTEVFFQRRRQALEWFQPRAPRPAHPTWSVRPARSPRSCYRGLP